MKQIIPVIKDQGAVDRRPDVVRERRVGIAPLECVELPILEIAQSRCEALADQREQPEDMIAGAAGVGEMLLDVEDRVLVKQPIEYVGRLAFSRAYRQNAEIAVLIRQMAVELRPGFTAVVEIDVAAFGGAIARAEELAVGR